VEADAQDVTAYQCEVAGLIQAFEQGQDRSDQDW
jgi:hypothetical protein